MKRTLVLLAAVSASILGCSANERPLPREPREYKVSVSTDGRELKNFEQELVHRLEVRESDVDVILASMPAKINLPFDWAAERDSRGKLKGVRLLKRKKGYDLPDLGLKAGDLITAAEGKLTSDLRDLALLLKALRENKSASLTFERGGVPHKSFYALAPKKRRK